MYDTFSVTLPRYSTQCDRMLTDYQNQNNCDLTHMSDSDKLKLLLNTSVKPVARFIIQIFNIRTQTLSRQNWSEITNCKTLSVNRNLYNLLDFRNYLKSAS
jgi:hypothetical protein